jgi:hypothetical protein
MFSILRVLSRRDAPDTDPPPGARLRRAPRACDDALNGTSRAWLRQLPAGRRPLRLCERLPRLANRIAWCWADAALVDAVFDDLLTDRRGGRQGFPKAVVTELRRLRDYRVQWARQ